MNFGNKSPSQNVYIGYRDNDIANYNFWNGGGSGGGFAQITAAQFNGTLNGHANQDLALGGGTMTGDLTVPSIFASDWFRATGQCGLYFADYGGGWYMTDTTWIRAYNDKNVYTPGVMQADGGFNGKATSAGYADSAGNGVAASGTNYIRFSNGIQICWELKHDFRTSSTGSQNIAFSFAVPFARVDYAWVSLDSANGNNYERRMTSYSTTSVTMDAYLISTVTHNAYMFAVGVWK